MKINGDCRLMISQIKKPSKRTDAASLLTHLYLKIKSKKIVRSKILNLRVAWTAERL